MPCCARCCLLRRVQKGAAAPAAAGPSSIGQIAKDKNKNRNQMDAAKAALLFGSKVCVLAPWAICVYRIADAVSVSVRSRTAFRTRANSCLVRLTPNPRATRSQPLLFRQRSQAISSRRTWTPSTTRAPSPLDRSRSVQEHSCCTEFVIEPTLCVWQASAAKKDSAAGAAAASGTGAASSSSAAGSYGGQCCFGAVVLGERC